MNPRLSLVIGILCISFSPILVRVAGVPPVSSAFYRIAFAWLALTPYCLLKGHLRIGRRDLLAALLAGIIFASDIAIWNLSLMKMSTTISTLVANLAPVWVGLISFFILRRRSGVFFWAGTFVAVTGMVILIGYRHLIHMQVNTGLVYALSASVLYATYILLSKGILGRIGTLTFMFYNMLGASCFLLLICIFFQVQLSGFHLTGWMSLLAMGLICQLIGWITINHALHALAATRVSVALLSQTVLAGLLAAIFLHETLRFEQLIGSAVVLAGIALSFLRRGVVKNQ